MVEKAKYIEEDYSAPPAYRAPICYIAFRRQRDTLVVVDRVMTQSPRVLINIAFSMIRVAGLTSPGNTQIGVMDGGRVIRRYVYSSTDLVIGVID